MVWRDPLLEIADYRKSAELVFKNIGYVDFSNHNNPVAIFTWILPDVIFLFTVIIIFNSDKHETRVSRKHSNMTNIEPNHFKNHLSIFLSLLCIVLVAIIRPSVINSVYFITFIVIMTWLSTNQSLGKKFDTFLLTFAHFVSCHILLIFAFHSTSLNLMGLSNNNFLQRMLGLDQFVKYNDDELSFKVVTSLDWDQYLHLPILILTHYIFSTTGFRLRRNRQRMANQRNEQQIEMSEVRLSFLESVMNATRKISQIVKKRDSKLLENKFLLMQTIGKFFVTLYAQNIHIFTNICMMTYSIVFHSWFGFVLLMWSQVSWLIADQHQYILKSSPFIVAYAIIQLLVAYIAGMEWKSDDFPRRFFSLSFDHNQLGIVFQEHYPSFSLMIRILFSLQFWMTMTIRFRERRISNTNNKPRFAQMMDNLREDNNDSNKTLKKLWRMFSSFIVNSWMWLILLTMLMISLQDEKMTSPKVDTMACCLVFILTFIMSFSLWIKFNYIFWFFMIIKSMCYLIGTYIFQFKGWHELFGIESILGLSKLKKGDLFIQLSSLTVVIIMTGIQINFFHYSLMESLNKKKLRKTEESQTEAHPELIYNVNMEHIYDIIEIIFNGIFFLAVFHVSIENINFFSIIFLGILILQLQSKSSIFKIFIYQVSSIIIACYIEFFMFYNYQKEKGLHWFSTTCTNNRLAECLVHSKSISSAMELSYCHFPEWIGFKDNRGDVIVKYFIIIVLVAVRVAIKYHRSRQSEPTSLKNYIKTSIDAYLKMFGKEIFCALTFLLIIYRQDSISLVYTIMLMWISLKNQDSLTAWLISKRIIQISLTFQCALMWFHMFVEDCTKIPASPYIAEQVLNFVLENPLHVVQNPDWMLLEYVLLMLTTQLNSKFDHQDKKHCKPLSNMGNERKRRIEKVKKYFMKFHLWTTLILIFMISNSSIDVYTIGYITFVFKFLWQGSDFYLKSTVDIITEWDWLKIFNIIVFVFKFHMKVLVSYSDKIEIFDSVIFTIHSRNFMRDFWIFNLIMIQRKLFKSKDFLSVIAETFITINLLSSRGAEMFDELRLKEIRSNIITDKKGLAKFRFKMELIKEKNRKEFAQQNEPSTHTEALQSGTYDMFEEDDDLESGRATEAVIDDLESENIRNFLNDSHKRVFDSFTTLEAFKLQIVSKSKFVKKTLFKILLKISEKLRSKTKKSSHISNILTQEKEFLRNKAETLISEQ